MKCPGRNNEVSRRSWKQTLESIRLATQRRNGIEDYWSEHSCRAADRVALMRPTRRDCSRNLARAVSIKGRTKNAINAR